MGNRVDLFSPCGVNRSRRATISVTVARNNPGGQSRLIIPGRGGRPQDDSPANRLVLPGKGFFLMPRTHWIRTRPALFRLMLI